MLFDTHSHLDDEDFDPNRDAVVQRARAAGIESILVVGTTVATSRKCLAIAHEYAGLYAAVGMHPNHAGEAVPGDWDEIVRLARQPRVVAVGETGLDLFRNYTPLSVQQDYFDRHIRLAQERELPFVVHMRQATVETLDVLRAAARRGPLRGIMHAYSADAATAAECVALGLHISFAGMVTYKKSDTLREAAQAVPADRLLIETDAPYLSPEPCRSQRPNEPALLVHTASFLARLRGQSPEEFAAQTTANARRLLRA